MQVLNWWGEHWVLGTMLFPFAFWLACTVTVGSLRLCARVLGMVMVLCRGWPPEHLDADGDWRPPQESET